MVNFKFPLHGSYLMMKLERIRVIVMLFRGAMKEVGMVNLCNASEHDTWRQIITVSTRHAVPVSRLFRPVSCSISFLQLSTTQADGWPIALGILPYAQTSCQNMEFAIQCGERNVETAVTSARLVAVRLHRGQLPLP